jgi:hypothetical protein
MHVRCRFNTKPAKGSLLPTSPQPAPHANQHTHRSHRTHPPHLEHALQLVCELGPALRLDLGDAQLLRVHAGAAPHEQAAGEDALVEGLKHILPLHRQMSMHMGQLATCRLLCWWLRLAGGIRTQARRARACTAHHIPHTLPCPCRHPAPSTHPPAPTWTYRNRASAASNTSSRLLSCAAPALLPRRRMLSRYLAISSAGLSCLEFRHASKPAAQGRSGAVQGAVQGQAGTAKVAQ